MRRPNWRNVTYSGGASGLFGQGSSLIEHAIGLATNTLDKMQAQRAKNNENLIKANTGALISKYLKGEKIDPENAGPYDSNALAGAMAKIDDQRARVANEKAKIANQNQANLWAHQDRGASIEAQKQSSLWGHQDRLASIGAQKQSSLWAHQDRSADIANKKQEDIWAHKDRLAKAGAPGTKSSSIKGEFTQKDKAKASLRYKIGNKKLDVFELEKKLRKQYYLNHEDASTLVGRVTDTLNKYGPIAAQEFINTIPNKGIDDSWLSSLLGNDITDYTYEDLLKERKKKNPNKRRTRILDSNKTK